jgi:hypothetical protein
MYPTSVRFTRNKTYLPTIEELNTWSFQQLKIELNYFPTNLLAYLVMQFDNPFNYPTDNDIINELLKNPLQTIYNLQTRIFIHGRVY